MIQPIDAPKNCPTCALDWTAASAYMQSWQPCRCEPTRGGHRIYVCMACRSKLYDSAHLAPVLPMVAAG